MNQLCVFDNPEFTFRPLPEGCISTNPLATVTIHKRSGGPEKVYLLPGGGFCQFVKERFEVSGLDEVDLVVEWFDGRWYVSIREADEDEVTDLWYYTNKTMPRWLEKVVA